MDRINNSPLIKRKVITVNNATTSEELVQALHNKFDYDHQTNRYVCHYTSVNALTAIMKSGLWYVGSPKNMNDGLEMMSL